MAKEERSPEQPVRHAADTREQPLGINAQAVEGSTTPNKDADKTQSGILGDGANRIPLDELTGNAT